MLVPIKAFDAAKPRLSEALDPAERAQLARSMAAVVLRAAAPLPVAVVCDDDQVADWARRQGARVVWTPGLGLNGAVADAVRRAADEGVVRAVIAHSDLPFARDLERLVVTDDDLVLVVPDRRLDGTNVLSVPTDRGFEFHYGAGSFGLHRTEAARLGLQVQVRHIEELGWDVDEPGDLDSPSHLGAVRSPASPADGAERDSRTPPPNDRTTT